MYKSQDRGSYLWNNAAFLRNILMIYTIFAIICIYSSWHVPMKNECTCTRIQFSVIHALIVSYIFCKKIAIKYVSNNRTKIITVFSCMHQIIISIWYLGLLITFYTTTTWAWTLVNWQCFVLWTFLAMWPLPAPLV